MRRNIPVTRARRYLYAGLGILLTAIGVIGIITPVLPTTVFLILASGLFLKASPALHERLHRNRVTGPYLRAYTEGKGLSLRRKLTTIALLWLTLLVSAWFVRDHLWLLILLSAVGVGVTIHVATIRARGPQPDPALGARHLPGRPFGAGVAAAMAVWCGEEGSMPAQKTQGLPDRMRAIVAHGPGEFRFEEVDRPVAGEGEIVIRVEACGICAGDLKSFHGAPSFWGGEGNPPYIDAPVIPGHEFIGHIVELGENVDAYAHHGDTGFELGDRVISEQIVPTWTDRFSTTGRYWMDERHYVYGFQKAVNGGFAEYMKFPKEAINYKVPHDIPTEKAVLIEPYACSKHGVDRASIGGEDIVVISGAGVIGLGMVGAAKLRNPAKLIVLDLNDRRLERARQFGADLTMNPSREDVIGKIRELSGGYGCDKYIEVTGHPASVQQGLEALRKMGTFVEFSVFKDLVTVDWSIISDRKELDVLGGHLSPYCYRPVIEWIAGGDLPTDGVVTHRLPLEKWEEGFEMVDRGDESIKVVLEP